MIRDRRGNIIEDVGATRPPRDGKDIALAIDSKIQYIAYSHLKTAVSESKAKGGSVVVMDVRRREQIAEIPAQKPSGILFASRAHRLGG